MDRGRRGSAQHGSMGAAPMATHQHDPSGLGLERRVPAARLARRSRRVAPCRASSNRACPRWADVDRSGTSIRAHHGEGEPEREPYGRARALGNEGVQGRPFDNRRCERHRPPARRAGPPLRNKARRPQRACRRPDSAPNSAVPGFRPLCRLFARTKPLEHPDSRIPYPRFVDRNLAQILTPGRRPPMAHRADGPHPRGVRTPRRRVGAHRERGGDDDPVRIRPFEAITFNLADL